MTGSFIVLEGIDGCGSTTAAKVLGSQLQSHGVKVHITNEPTDGPAGALIRLALKKRVTLAPKAIALLFAADRLDHLNRPGTGILALLEQDYIVVSDRYKLSSYAYQSTEPGIELAWIKEINRQAREPDLTILMDLPPKQALERKVSQQTAEGMELYEYQEKQEAVRQCFLSSTKELIDKGHKAITIDAGKPMNEVHEEVLKLVTATLEA